MNGAPVFWFTGLSGAGKTTVAEGVRGRLAAQRRSVAILDGDDVRQRLHVNLGFSPEDIRTNNALIARLCEQERDRCEAILVPIISPYRASRADARRLLAPGFYEIYFCADLPTVINRDVKGLYARAQRNQLGNLIGYSPGSPYEPPESPDLVIDSGREAADESIARLTRFVAGVLDRESAASVGAPLR